MAARACTARWARTGLGCRVRRGPRTVISTAPVRKATVRHRISFARRVNGPNGRRVIANFAARTVPTGIPVPRGRMARMGCGGLEDQEVLGTDRLDSGDSLVTTEVPRHVVIARGHLIVDGTLVTGIVPAAVPRHVTPTARAAARTLVREIVGAAAHRRAMASRARAPTVRRADRMAPPTATDNYV